MDTYNLKLTRLQQQLTALEIRLEREVKAGRHNFPLIGKIKKLKSEYAKLRNQNAWNDHLAR